MKLEELNSMKYGDLLKLAKEKCNVTRRISKEKLIEMLLEQHKSYLSDSNFVSADESSSGDTSTEFKALEETTVKRGRKRGKQQEQKECLPSKKTKKESVEHNLNSTFSVEDSEEEKNKPSSAQQIVEPAKVEERKPRKQKGRKKLNVTMSPEPEKKDVVEPENEIIPVSQPLKPRKGKTIIVAARKLSEGKTKALEQKVEETVTSEQSMPNVSDVDKVAEPLKEPFSKNDSVLNSSTNNRQIEKPIPRKTRNTRSTSLGVQSSPREVANKVKTPNVEKIERSSFSADKSHSSTKLTKRSARMSTSLNASSPTVPIVETKTVQPAASSTATRARKLTASNINTPKPAILTPSMSAKKAVQFVGNNVSSNIPKLAKPKAAPNFAEIHQKNFLKMQSVDEYVEKKRARTETLTVSAKAVRTKSFINSTPQPKPVPPKTKTPESGRKSMKFNFVSGLQKPVFTAKGQVVNEKQRVMATVKENLHNASHISAVTTASSVSTGKKKASLLNVSREINASKLSLAGKQILKGVRTNRRFELQMQHRNTKN